MKTISEIAGDTVTVRVIPPSKHERLAALLLEAAGEDRKREVKSISTGGRGFRVPLDIWEKSRENLNDESPPAPDDAPADDSPAKPARKTAARKTAEKSAEKPADSGEQA